MKLICLFLLIAGLGAAHAGNSQGITLKEKNASLQAVLEKIKTQTGYMFLYTGDALSKAQKVTVELKDASLEQTLQKVFSEQPLSYTIVDKTVIIKPKPSLPNVNGGNESINNQPPPIDIKGRIVNEKGEPVLASVQVKGTGKGTTTNDNGEFELKSISDDAVLVISGVSIESFEVKVSGRSELALGARMKTVVGEEVVINTGYQKLKPNEVTGSVTTIDNTTYNRNVSTDFLSRLNGIAGGVYFFGSPIGIQNQLTNTASASTTGIVIRGQSTLPTGNVSSDPLIVVDNFIYNGRINNINPNDVESISILKDAAAASIWGAKSGNGVIVITTKKGRNNQKLKIDFNSNVTVAEKPELFYNGNFLNSADYIDVDLLLYSKGIYNAVLTSPARFPFTPAIEIAVNRKAGLISAADSANQIDALRKLDVRDQYSKYVYQKPVQQQYSIGLRGGGSNYTYALLLGYDKGRDNLVRNGSSRITVNSISTFTPVKNLEITGRIQYTKSENVLNNQFGINTTTIGGFYGSMYPYAQFADADGNHLAVVRSYRLPWVDTIQRQGYLDWHFRPLDEINLGDNKIKSNDLVLQASARYQFTSYLSAQVSFQNEMQNMEGRNYQSPQTYAARNLVNMFSSKSNGIFTYNFPLGGILNLNSNNLIANQVRGQIDFNKIVQSKHNISAIAGGEIRELKTTLSGYSLFGYDDQNGLSNNNLNFNNSYTTFPSGGSRLPAPTTTPGVNGITERYISYYSNLAYTYSERYTLSLSARRDGANLFGVKTNDKITPFWSTGVKWNLDKEKFYDFSWMPHLDLRATYGYNGNVYLGGANLTGAYSTDQITGLPVIYVQTPPNPELHWEKIKTINLAIDLATRNNFLSGSFEWYQKDGQDLIEDAPLAPSAGFTSFKGNAASTRTRGIDFNITSKNVDRKFKWFTTLLLTTVNDKVIHYDQKYQGTSLASSSTGFALEGKPLFSIFSYRWAGLDPANGDPQGYLNKQVSKNYTAILNNSSPDSLVFSGSARPTLFGALRNTLSYRNFSISANISYNFGYYFRRTSTSLNYRGVLLTPNGDYSKRWQKPGDEKNTTVPSLVYPNNDNRSSFYQYSEVLVEKGDHIRLNDVQLQYNFDKTIWRNMPFQHLQVYIYASNLGILWKANKAGLDPFYANSLAKPGRSISFGVRTSF